jgi:hypothetical protein
MPTQTPISPQSDDEAIGSSQELKKAHKDVTFYLSAPKLGPSSHEGREIPVLKL